jgi:hypothetical protein
MFFISSTTFHNIGSILTSQGRMAQLTPWIPVITAIVAGSFAVLTSLVTVFGLYLSHHFTLNRESVADSRLFERAVAKYRKGLVTAAFDLSKRINNILERDFGGFYLYGSESQKEYALQSTVYLFGQYFAWKHLFDREVQFLDGHVDRESSSSVQDGFQSVYEAFSTDQGIHVDEEFQCFGVDQQGFGEKMIVKADTEWRCVGYASFIEMEDNRWVKAFRDSFIAHVSGNASGKHRLRKIEESLSSLMGIVDKDCRYHREEHVVALNQADAKESE